MGKEFFFCLNAIETDCEWGNKEKKDWSASKCWTQFLTSLNTEFFFHHTRRKYKEIVYVTPVIVGWLLMLGVIDGWLFSLLFALFDS